MNNLEVAWTGIRSIHMRGKERKKEDHKERQKKEINRFPSLCCTYTHTCLKISDTAIAISIAST